MCMYSIVVVLSPSGLEEWSWGATLYRFRLTRLAVGKDDKIKYITVFLRVIHDFMFRMASRLFCGV